MMAKAEIKVETDFAVITVVAKDGRTPKGRLSAVFTDFETAPSLF